MTSNLKCFCSLKGGKILKKKSLWLILLFMVVVGMIIFLIFFQTNTAKKFKIGNNSTSQEIVNAILNMNSYQATIEVEINSNKNQNYYKIKQQYKRTGLF